MRDHPSPHVVLQGGPRTHHPEVPMPSEDNEIESLRRLAGCGDRQDKEIEHLRHLAGCAGRQDSKRHYLREWRIYRGLSRFELADRLDTPTWIVAEWEGGD